MEYNTGDILKLTGFSGIYSTVVILTLTENQTVTFNFIPCTDGDYNNYPVVQIGSQVWMEENLATTTFNDGTKIPRVTDNSTWINLTTPAYCWFSDDSVSYRITYGAFYNGYAVNTGKLCCRLACA